MKKLAAKPVKPSKIAATPIGIPPAPAYLRRDGCDLWQRVLREFIIPQDALPLLEMAAQSWDRWADARRAIDKHGSTFVDRFQQVKMRPEILIERDSRLAVAKFLRQLGLDIQLTPTGK